MANWGQLLSKLVPTRTPMTRSVLGRSADPDMFRQRLGQTLSRRDFMPKQQYDLDQKDVQLGSLWAKLKSISPDLFKQKSDQAAAIGKSNTGIITENLPLAPPGKVSRTGKPMQKKTGGLASALGRYMSRGADIAAKTSPLRLVANSSRAKTLPPKLQSVVNDKVLQVYSSPVTLGAGAATAALLPGTQNSVPDNRITSTYTTSGNSKPLFQRVVPGHNLEITPDNSVINNLLRDTVRGQVTADLSQSGYKSISDPQKASFAPTVNSDKVPYLRLPEHTPRFIAYHELAHRFDPKLRQAHDNDSADRFEVEIPAMAVENATAMRNGWSPQQPSWVYDHMKKHGPQIQNNVQEDIPQIKSFMEQLRGDTELGRRYKDYLDAQGALKKTGSVAGGLVSTFMKQLNPLRLAGNALTPVPIKGSFDFAKDIGKYKAGTLTGGKLPLTNSSIKNIAIPTVTGVAVDQALPDDWKSKMFGDWNRKVIQPLGKDLSAWLNRPARSLISAH